MEEKKKNIHGVLAEFKNPKELIDAASTVEKSGYNKYDTYAPFPIHGMEKAMGLKKSPLGWIVLAGAVTGLVGIVALMVWVMAYAYPLNISGKPFINIPIYVPVAFELTVLFSAFAAVFGMFYLNGLPRFHNPLFNVERFKRASDDGFFICIEARDDLFSEEKVSSLFSDAGATHIETVYDS